MLQDRLAFCAFHGLWIMFCVPGPLEMENGEKSLWTICVRSGRTSCGTVGQNAFGALQKLMINTRLKREQDGRHKRHLKEVGEL